MFKHFVLTRFNIKLDNIPNHNKNNQPIRNDSWLKERFFLFEKYCMPSMIEQSNNNFIWLVLFSSDTPAKYLQKIEKYKLQFSFFKPLFLKNGDYLSIQKAFNEEYPKYLKASDQYLITSRIDNDDAFHKDMIKEVQNRFNRQNDIFLSFIYGLQYDINKKVLARIHFERNHFISRIEKISNSIETVITHDHTQIEKIAKVIFINNKRKPMWLEIIHEGNIFNEFYSSSLPQCFCKIHDSFRFKVEISKQNTIISILKYARLQFFLARNAIMRRLGIYVFLRKILKEDITPS